VATPVLSGYRVWLMALLAWLPDAAGSLVLFQLVGRQVVPSVAVAVIIGIGTCEFRELICSYCGYMLCHYILPFGCLRAAYAKLA